MFPSSSVNSHSLTNEKSVLRVNYRLLDNERQVLPGSKHNGSDGLLPPAVQVGLGAGLILEVDVSILLGEGPSLESDHATWLTISRLNLKESPLNILKSELDKI